MLEGVSRDTLNCRARHRPATSGLTRGSKSMARATWLDGWSNSPDGSDEPWGLEWGPCAGDACNQSGCLTCDWCSTYPLCERCVQPKFHYCTRWPTAFWHKRDLNYDERWNSSSGANDEPSDANQEGGERTRPATVDESYSEGNLVRHRRVEDAEDISHDG